jgi:hypothetical protein
MADLEQLIKHLVVTSAAAEWGEVEGASCSGLRAAAVRGQIKLCRLIVENRTTVVVQQSLLSLSGLLLTWYRGSQPVAVITEKYVLFSTRNVCTS